MAVLESGLQCKTVVQETDKLYTKRNARNDHKMFHSSGKEMTKREIIKLCVSDAAALRYVIITRQKAGHSTVER